MDDKVFTDKAMIWQDETNKKTEFLAVLIPTMIKLTLTSAL